MAGEDDVFVDERMLHCVPSAKEFVGHKSFSGYRHRYAHGMYKGEPKLDFQRLSFIKEVVDVPLVLHGASGVPEASIREAIRRGICKINIATELKIPMADAIKECFKNNPDENDPRNYMGNAKQAVKKAVREKIRMCMSNGFADELKRL